MLRWVLRPAETAGSARCWRDLELSDAELIRVEQYEGRRAKAWLLPIVGPAKSVVASRTYLREADGEEVGDTNAVAALPIEEVIADAQAAFVHPDVPLVSRVLDAVSESEDDGLTSIEIEKAFPDADRDELIKIGCELIASFRLVPTGQKRENAPVYVQATQTNE